MMQAKSPASARPAFSSGPARCSPMSARRFTSAMITATASGSTKTLEICAMTVTATGLRPPSAGTIKPEHAAARQISRKALLRGSMRPTR